MMYLVILILVSIVAFAWWSSRDEKKCCPNCKNKKCVCTKAESKEEKTCVAEECACVEEPKSEVVVEEAKVEQALVKEEPKVEKKKVEKAKPKKPAQKRKKKSNKK